MLNVEVQAHCILHANATDTAGIVIRLAPLHTKHITACTSMHIRTHHLYQRSELVGPTQPRCAKILELEVEQIVLCVRITIRILRITETIHEAVSQNASDTVNE